MAHLRIRIEEMEYRPDEKALVVLGVDAFSRIVTLEISPVFPRQMAADLEFVALHPNARVVVGEDVTDPAGNDGSPATVDGKTPTPPET